LTGTSARRCRRSTQQQQQKSHRRYMHDANSARYCAKTGTPVGVGDSCLQRVSRNHPVFNVRCDDASVPTDQGIAIKAALRCKPCRDRLTCCQQGKLTCGVAKLLLHVRSVHSVRVSAVPLPAIGVLAGKHDISSHSAAASTCTET
jgi:hypothetical protein